MEEILQNLGFDKRAITEKRVTILELLRDSHDNIASIDHMLETKPSLRTYHGSKQYLGQTLSKMIKLGMIIRVSRGIYGLSDLILEKIEHEE